MAPVRRNKLKKETPLSLGIEKVEPETAPANNGETKTLNGKQSNGDETFCVQGKIVRKGKQKTAVGIVESENVPDEYSENAKVENGVVEEEPESSETKRKNATKSAKESRVKTGKRGRQAKNVHEAAKNGSPEKKAKIGDNIEKPKRGRTARVATKTGEEDVKDESKIVTTEVKTTTKKAKIIEKKEANLDLLKSENGTAPGDEKEKKTKNRKEKVQPQAVTSTEKTVLIDSERKTADGRPFSLKISSWNVAGLRSWFSKGAHKFLIDDEKPDILFVQETKLSKDEDLDVEFRKMSGYHCYSTYSKKKGYAGVTLYTKIMPMNVDYGLGKPEHDEEGRVITAEYEKFYLVGVYVPNSSRGLVRLEYRQTWNEDFLNYLKHLDAKKPVILCGDLNVAHQEIDLANPKTNKKNAGFTAEERADFMKLLDAGFVDAFRHLYPQETGAYTFWTNMRNCREKNVGWRVDYFVISEKLVKDLCDCVLRKDVLGSDHCPLTAFLAL